jgi:hypothetical protein
VATPLSTSLAALEMVAAEQQVAADEARLEWSLAAELGVIRTQ